MESDVTVETDGPAVSSAGDEGVAETPDEGTPDAGTEATA